MHSPMDNINHYSKYFRMKMPGSIEQMLFLLLMGVIAGAISNEFIYAVKVHYFDSRILVLGASIGIMSISMPAFLAVILVKALNRRILLKHAFTSTSIISLFYAIIFLINAVAFAFLNNLTIAYLVLLVANAGIYGYWFVMGRVVIRKKSTAITSAVQPVLNVLLFLPFSIYLFGVNFPVNLTLVKLVLGMLVFLVAGYAFLYSVDKPAKKFLGVSGVEVFSSMLSYWLYNFSAEAHLISSTNATARSLEIRVLAVKSGNAYKAVFINPDIHFGPFANAGGSIATEYIGTKISKEFDAAPFILHSTVDLQDNPVSTAEVHSIANNVVEMLKSNTKFSRATGSVSFGKGKICRAIDIKIGDVRLLILSKAPYVTEDIKRDVGKKLEEYAKKLIGNKGKVILIDAHNTRFESAPKEELEGIRSTKSKYFKDYEKAIADALAKETNNSLKIGFASRRLFELIGKRKDIGNGYTSVCVVQNGHEKFCFIYFDANNMLPGFRKEIIEHIEEKFDMRAELCTTDTHAINLVSEDASNALGRYTKPNEIIPVLDLLIGSAIGNLDYAYYAFASRSIDNFKVWGPNASELIKKTSIEIRHRVLRIVPFLIIAAFIIAAWIISFA